MGKKKEYQKKNIKKKNLKQIGGYKSYNINYIIKSHYIEYILNLVYKDDINQSKEFKGIAKIIVYNHKILDMKILDMKILISQLNLDTKIRGNKLAPWMLKKLFNYILKHNEEVKALKDELIINVHVYKGFDSAIYFYKKLGFKIKNDNHSTYTYFIKLTTLLYNINNYISNYNNKIPNINLSTI